MNHRVSLAPAAVLAASMLLAACSVLPRAESVVIDRYTLEAMPQAVQTAHADGPVLLVTRPLARADLNSPRMAYREQDYQLRYFARSRWTDTPAQLLLPGLVEALEASGHFGAVIRVGSAARPGLRLDTEVLEFSQDFRTEPSEFQIRLRLQMVDLESMSVMASRIFTVRQAATERSPQGGARAANAAWQALLPELVGFGIQALADR